MSAIISIPIVFGTKPYEGAGDSKLPKHVQKMSLAKRKRWVSTFNSVYKKDSDEGKAMRIANSTV